ncbi:YolD-like family protein [Priestia megaterium]|uniref:YolD-like family protein n=1 Tax=Priestia megaterium TaxID=1404 RepID=UPI002A69A5FB|nr:YolD-like family protein [Priestia megaterium]MDY0943945.1 YolD-like family protein [Priestia megaterium]
MLLKGLSRNRLITISYYKAGLLKTCKGRIYNLDLCQQILSIKDEHQQVCCIRLSGIKEIR